MKLQIWGLTIAIIVIHFNATTKYFPKGNATSDIQISQPNIKFLIIPIKIIRNVRRNTRDVLRMQRSNLYEINTNIENYTAKKKKKINIHLIVNPTNISQLLIYTHIIIFFKKSHHSNKSPRQLSITMNDDSQYFDTRPKGVWPLSEECLGCISSEHRSVILYTQSA